MSDAASDFDLLEQWGSGDLTAGSALFERHFESLYRFFRNKAQDGIEDLMQQTLLACVEGRARFRREASFRTFLFQVARFQLYSHYRKLRRDPRLDFEVITAADLGTSPSGTIARRQDARLLLEALRRIPVDHQLVLELYFWEGLSGAEIADTLDIPEPTVRSRLRRGTERLRVEMTSLTSAEPGLRDTFDDLEAWAARLRELVEHEADS